MSDERPIMITGASGFVGARIAEMFYLNGWGKPRAVIRNWTRAARIARLPLDVALCDIMEPDQVRTATKGSRAVVHCAYTNDRDVIVEGTRNLLKAALDEGVDRFIFMSTAEVYGSGARGDIAETAMCEFTGNAYGDAKIEAERLCWEFEGLGLPVTILRPPLVYGPFGVSWTIDVAERLQSGNWGVFEDIGEGLCNLVYVDDLVHAVRLAIEQDTAVGEAFNINGPQVETWNQYFKRFNETLGLPPLAAVSPSHTRLKSAVMDRAGKFIHLCVDPFQDRLMKIYLRGGTMSKVMARVKQTLDTTPSSAELNNLYSRRAHYVIDKAERLLGYVPAFGLDRGLELSVAWLRHHGFVDDDTTCVSNSHLQESTAATAAQDAS